MAYGDDIDRRQRVMAGGAAVAATLFVGLGLFGGWQPAAMARDVAAISAFNVTRPVPVPEPEPARTEHAAPRQAAAAAPPNRRARPREIVAPPRILPPIVDVPPAAPVAGSGPDAAAGAAERAGLGTGAGGTGVGLGSGGAGDGTGGGGNPARWRSGSIRNRDYPRDASRANVGGTVDARLTVAPNGRVTACAIMRSSGTPSLDATTCRLAIARFRFVPARNAAGEAITADTGWRQRWWLDGMVED